MRLLIVVAALSLFSCGAADRGPPAAVLRVLFVGNSLTTVNDLPAMVKEIAAADGVILDTRTIAKPNYGLADHWQEGEVQQEIIAERWDVVVVQQGPSSLESSRVDLDRWALAFDRLADEHHTCLAFYMVWPDASRLAYFPDVYAHYREAADTTGGQFLPAGDAWSRAWRIDGSLPLYGPDNFHPSPLGTYAAALVIAAGLTGVDPVGNTAQIPGITTTGAARSAVQVAARNALNGVPRRCTR